MQININKLPLKLLFNQFKKKIEKKRRKITSKGTKIE